MKSDVFWSGEFKACPTHTWSVGESTKGVGVGWGEPWGKKPRRRKEVRSHDQPEKRERE